MLPVAAVLLAMPMGARGFRFKAKPVLVVLLVLVAVVEVAEEVPAAVPGGFTLKFNVPVPRAPEVVAGVPRESPAVVDEVGAAAIEEKREGPAMEVVAAGVGAAG